jgi:hypothetical protein
MRFSSVVLAYFFIGALMWGGGVIQWDDAGVGTLFVEEPGTDGATAVNQDTAHELEGLAGPIQQAAQTVGGGALIAIWNLVVKLIGFLFWPLTTLAGLNAPPRATVVFGGPFVVAFFVSVLRLLRESA